ncbi:MAG: hypothetical protein ABIU09_12830 [Pyrinomonadaceae bacterium]
MDDKAKIASRELGDAVNAALESSVRVRDAIERLREIGYQPNLTLRLELSRIRPGDTDGEGFDMELSEEDLKTLQRMKIRFE